MRFQCLRVIAVDVRVTVLTCSYRCCALVRGQLASVSSQSHDRASDLLAPLLFIIALQGIRYSLVLGLLVYGCLFVCARSSVRTHTPRAVLNRRMRSGRVHIFNGNQREPL